MAKGRGGYGGYGAMPGNMNNLMKQAQRMQREMQEKQEALEQQEFTASSGGGAVSVTMNGKREMLALTISPEAVDPDDVEMLQDMVISAVNEVLRQIEAANEETMAKLTGGMGGFGGLF
ncbi:MAG: YbaB/EbfC family nucleoid-associated protein [Lachnospiraceae bacterium]|nr:YbaB/EbfC family nucleoid-associated protein [Lachnospiraceae bacterium]